MFDKEHFLPRVKELSLSNRGELIEKSTRLDHIQNKNAFLDVLRKHNQAVYLEGDPFQSNVPFQHIIETTTDIPQFAKNYSLRLQGRSRKTDEPIA